MSKNRPKADVESGLTAKGFQQVRQTNHNYYIFHTKEGTKSPIKTKTSLGRKPKEIGGDLLSAMARQCKLNTKDFLRLIDCPLSREEYEGLLQNDGHL